MVVSFLGQMLRHKLIHASYHKILLILMTLILIKDNLKKLNSMISVISVYKNPLITNNHKIISQISKCKNPLKIIKVKMISLISKSKNPRLIINPRIILYKPKGAKPYFCKNFMVQSLLRLIS